MEDISDDDENGERGEEKGKISNQKLEYLESECGSANVKECPTKIVVFVANLIEIILKGCEWDSAKSECVPNKEAKEFVSLGEGEKKKKKKKQGKWRSKRKN
ncbi:hypothetical protein niasHT_002651 [Heterodera trifolii]|uniref:Uncharacterized protein n=1 Tax=Heterodera trifolii TaxID=157864 RepID=A0ABD2JGW3_9BILA